MTRRATAIALLSFSLVIAALATRNGDLALLALPFLTYLGAGIIGAPLSEDIRLSADRSADCTPAGDATSIRVRLKVRNEAATDIALQLTEPVRPETKITRSDLKQRGGELHTWMALAGGEETELAYTFEAGRGNYSWQTLRVTATDPFGLFESDLVLPAAAGLEVRPKRGKFRLMSLPADCAFHSPGSLPARLAGTGTDFWGLREYHPGDPLRRLDWRMAARHPSQFFTKEFEQEEIADVGLIVDARQKTDARIGEDSLFERTVTAAASLAEALLHQGHRVSLLVFGDQIMTVFPGYSKAQLNRILQCLARTTPGSSTSRVSLDYVPLGMFSSRALLVIFSPLAAGDWRLFPRLRARGNHGLLICPDTLAFLMPGPGADRDTRLAIRAARIERRLELRKIAGFHIRVVDWQVDQPLSPLVRDAFRRAAGAGKRIDVRL